MVPEAAPAPAPVAAPIAAPAAASISAADYPSRSQQGFQLDGAWQPQLEALLAAGRAAGADLVEVFLERKNHLGVLAEQELITSVSPAFGMGAGIRVFLAERDGFVSTNDLSEAGLRRAL